MKKRFFKFVAKGMLLTLSYQLIFPACAYALTTGPSQPEVQSFEPVGTTEMVDMFTGDFNYNIPLMDVEGYPINIFYHSGIGIEQEASWVGLGWNINPGEINRTVRGLPDDFKGETIEKEISIKEEKEVKIGIGADVFLELFGKNLNETIDKFMQGDYSGAKDHKSTGFELGVGLGVYVAHNNYRGLSAGINQKTTLNTPVGSLGINLGIGTQSGSDIDMSLATPNLLAKNSSGGYLSANAGVGFNSRAGLKDISLGMSVAATQEKDTKHGNPTRKAIIGNNFSTNIPIGLQNYVPAMTNKIVQNSLQVQIKAGVSGVGMTVSGYIDGMKSTVSYDKDASRAGYGYLYLENADQNGILDFTREKDGMYNKTLKNLPASGMAYDVYSVNGHGTGGMFRAHRNDIGTIYDPYVFNTPEESKAISNTLEAGIPGVDYFEIGDDLTWINTVNKSGAWTKLDFSNKQNGSLFENVFFKQAGELTYNQQQEATVLFNNTTQYVKEDLNSLFSNRNNVAGSLPNINYQIGNRILWDNVVVDRSSRATNFSFKTAKEIMSIPEMDNAKKIISYNDNGTTFYNPILKNYNRYGENEIADHLDKAHHISEFTQTTSDGRRYVYGIPALNNISREVTFAVKEENADLNSGYVTYNDEVGKIDDSKNNTRGTDNFYSSTTTPTHAHSYLLTSLLSSDYVDILGDGPTDDDLGTFVKYNYTLKSNDYRWRTPYPSNKAQYNPGFSSDNQDGKGNYIVGSRQQWYTRSIETKNYVAEFYTSPRVDAKGITTPITTSGKYSSNAASNEHLSYKLDSIKLYNKHDRYINKDNATPIKTVIFNYNYQLCNGVPNSLSGKLTLKKIFIKYGNSQKNLLSPYVFEYDGHNPNYDFAAKDRWGNFKNVVSGVHNYEFPYTNQPDNTLDLIDLQKGLTAWNLTDIKLPSGGKIHLDYESDDYSFVQNRRSMQMLHIEGLGSTKKMIPQDKLYIDKDNVNDYIYFKRRIDKENSNLSLRENYLEDQKLLYYSFAIDITATGKYEHINGYGEIEDVGLCEDNPSSPYAYIKLKRNDVRKLKMNPASFLGMNTGKYYMPHLFYDGYSVGEDVFALWKSLIKQAPKLISTIFNENPYKEFIRQGKAKYIQINNSWIRIQTPGLTKYGGGIRVKKLILSDNWQNLSGNENASYGKKYDYTLDDKRYGKISSGVASYEPMIGADENPFRRPVPYSVDAGRGLPSVDFFQEEPFGESFFPSPSVGYSCVKVSSIHEQYGRSAQALDEYQFYTAKDYPIRVDYTEKESPEDRYERTLTSQFQESQALQGYSIIMNDMHGKAKLVNNYVVHKDGSNIRTELITGSKYLYNEDSQNQLNNSVKSLFRKRGTQSNYELKDVILGQDMDLTIDSRFRSSESNMKKTSIGLNMLQILGVPSPVPSLWRSTKTNTKQFKSMVTTKIIQQYGILRAIESIDHGAKTTTENLVYDAETATPILTRTNNEFNDYNYNLTHPAYLAYEGIRPAYTNDGYEEVMDSLVVNQERDGFLYTNNFDRFTDGDELLVRYRPDKSGEQVFKLWVLGTGADLYVPPTPDKGYVAFGMHKESYECTMFKKASIIVKSSSGAVEASGIIDDHNLGSHLSVCDDLFKGFKKELAVGTYTYEVKTEKPSGTTTGSFEVKKGECTPILFTANCPDYGYLTTIKLNDGLGKIQPSDCWLTGDPTKWNLAAENNYTNKCIRLKTGDYTLYATNRSKEYSTKIKIKKDKVTKVEIFQRKSLSTPIEFETYNDLDLSNCDGDDDFIGGGGSGGGGDTRRTSKMVKTPVLEPGSETPVLKDLRCALKVAPRFKDKLQGTVNKSTWPSDYTVYRNVLVKVIRSGRRNNLNQTVQQTTFTVPKSVDFSSEHMATVDKLFIKTEGILSVGVKTYTDNAQIYTPFTNEMDIVGEYKYGQFNPFVLGCRGNFRPSASYAPLTNRRYEGHSRSDGDFQIATSNQFWSIANGIEIPSTVCDGNTDLFREQSRTGPLFWKLASEITRYDVFGNAIEERDAIGNYSTAQYGYNKSLPVSVASNAKYQQFMFDGFEDYNMLLPEKIAALFLKGDLYSAFAILYGNNKAGSDFTFYGQKYHLRELAPSGSSIVLSQEENHTGYFSMKALSAATFTFNVGNAVSDKIGAFKFAPNNKYLVQLWAKSNSGLPITDGMFKTTHGPTKDMKVKSGSIDGWYQVEALVDVTSVSTTFYLEIPANVFVDDIRIFPNKSNMKSFVYDPISFKLVAQLDENHYATFFEYDQEGLLVRTKKETTKGIVTISESRRSNSKKTNISTSSSSGTGGSSGGGSTY